MYTIQAGGFIPGFGNTMAWGLFPVDSEIPLVSSLRTQACSWKGLWSLGVYKHPRRPGGQQPGPSEPAEVGACGSAQLSCPVLGALGKSLPLCLLPARGGEGGQLPGGRIRVGLAAKPYSAGSLLASPVCQAPVCMWEPIHGGLHFLGLSNYIFPHTHCSLKKITREQATLRDRR